MSQIKFLKFLPFFIIFFLIIFLSIPHNILKFGIYTPEYIIIFIFYLCLFNNKFLPIYLLAILGLEYDLVMKYPIGVNLLTFLSIKYFLNLQRKFLIHKNFYIIWLFFIIDLVIIMIIKLLLLKISYSLPLKEIYLGLLIKIYFTILVYPIIHLFLDWIINFVNHR